MIFDLLTPPQGPSGRGHLLLLHASFITHTPNLVGFCPVVKEEKDGRTKTDGRSEAITISPSLFF